MKFPPLLKSFVQATLVVGLGVTTLFCTSIAQLANAAEAAQKTYTVEPGDTLDKVIRKFYPGSPLKIEVLRSLITERNRAAFTKGESKVLMAGAVLSLPDQMEMASSVLAPKGERAADKGEYKGEYKGENGLGADSANLHRSWVRFP